MSKRSPPRVPSYLRWPARFRPAPVTCAVRPPASARAVEALERRQLLTVANGGFEDDLNGWMVNTAPDGAIYTIPFVDSYSPVEGSSLATLWPGAADVYSLLSQTFQAGAGATLSGWAFFVSGDSSVTGDDDAHVAIKDQAGQTVATPFEKSVATVGDYGRTDWLYWEHVFAEAGTYTVEAAVRNVTTNHGFSQLGVDGIELSEVSSPNEPVTLDPGGPYTVPEGEGLSLGAIGVDGNGDTVTYAWDINNDGVFNDVYGQAPHFTWNDLVRAGINDGPGSYDIAVRANDRRGSIVVSHTTITVVNVPPQGVTLIGPDTVTDGSRAAYTASAWDPAGTADPLEYTWAVTRDDDGSTLAGGTGTAFAFTPTVRGLYTVSLTVGDGDDAVGMTQPLSVVENVGPDLDVIESGYYVGEGQPFLYEGYFTDPNTWDTSHHVIIDWGDGTEPTVFLPGAQFQGRVLNGYLNPANGHAYYLLDNMDWPQADAYARGLGGHLVSLNDASEAQWVDRTFGTREWGFPQPYWIGLTDAESYTTEGSFVWTSGEPVTYTRWHEGEPNNSGGDEDYGMAVGAWGGAWNDSSHSNERAVVELDAPYQFPRGDQGNERYFGVLHTYADEGDDHRRNGPGEGSYFITVTVTDEKGLSDSGQTEVVVFNRPAAVSSDDWLMAEEGKEVDFHGYFADAGVNDTWTVTVDYGDGSDLVTLHPDRIGPLDLRHTYADQGSYVVHYTAQDNDSSEPFETLSHIEIFNAPPTIKQISLPSTSDEGRDVTLSALVGDFGDDSITLTVDWGDGHAPDVFTPPAGPPQPFSASHAYDDDGTYYVTLTATDEDGGEVVRTSAGQLPEVAIQWEESAGGNGHWYGRAYVPEHNAPAAYALAAELGGHLVTITSEAEQQFLNDTFLFGGYPYGRSWTSYWIGLSDAAQEGTFAWVTGEPLTYTNWGQGEPDDSGPAGEDFAVMNWRFSSGQWPSTPGDWSDVDEVHTGAAPPEDALVEFNEVPPPLSVTVHNVAPTVSVSGPASGVRGQARQFFATVTDPGLLDSHTVTWQVLRGTTVVASGAGTLAEFTPVDAGQYVVRFTAVDDDGGAGTGSGSLNVKLYEYQPHPTDPTKTILAVGGTAAGDTAVVKSRPGGAVEVVLNDVLLGTFKPTGGVYVFGQAGNDHVVVTTTLPVPLTFFGGDGDDTLRSNNFSDLLIGGPGDDRVLGNARSA